MHEATLQSGNSEPALLRQWALAALIVSLPVFLIFPDLDLQISSYFFTSEHGFYTQSPLVEAVRNAFKLIYILACICVVTGFAYTYMKRSRFLSLNNVHCLFLITCFAIGPGLVANLVFKDNWGRARPREVVQFGGEKTFTPAVIPAQQCKRNCAFVSGEASSMFMVFFASALLFPRWSMALIITGLATGFSAGVVRIAQGGHFLSDVIFAGILMALTAAAIHRLFVSGLLLSRARLEYS